jgi:integrase/recombinase XerD
MTPLRQTMIQAMCQHGFSPRTQHSYLYFVTALARYYRRSPDQLKVEDLQVFFNYLVQERSLSPASCRVYLHGIRFLYLKVLHWLPGVTLQNGGPADLIASLGGA